LLVLIQVGLPLIPQMHPLPFTAKNLRFHAKSHIPEKSTHLSQNMTLVSFLGILQVLPKALNGITQQFRGNSVLLPTSRGQLRSGGFRARVYLIRHSFEVLREVGCFYDSHDVLHGSSDYVKHQWQEKQQPFAANRPIAPLGKRDV
jgi:hypothetical protein